MLAGIPSLTCYIDFQVSLGGPGWQGICALFFFKSYSMLVTLASVFYEESLMFVCFYSEKHMEPF